MSSALSFLLFASLLVAAACTQFSQHIWEVSTTCDKNNGPQLSPSFNTGACDSIFDTAAAVTINGNSLKSWYLPTSFYIFNSFGIFFTMLQSTPSLFSLTQSHTHSYIIALAPLVIVTPYSNSNFYFSFLILKHTRTHHSLFLHSYYNNSQCTGSSANCDTFTLNTCYPYANSTVGSYMFVTGSASTLSFSLFVIAIFGIVSFM
jgi:hypothetical protein